MSVTYSMIERVKVRVKDSASYGGSDRICSRLAKLIEEERIRVADGVTIANESEYSAVHFADDAEVIEKWLEAHGAKPEPYPVETTRSPSQSPQPTVFRSLAEFAKEAKPRV